MASIWSHCVIICRMSGAIAAPGRVCRRMSAQRAIMACMFMPWLPADAPAMGEPIEGDIGDAIGAEDIGAEDMGAEDIGADDIGVAPDEALRSDAQAAGRIVAAAKSPIVASFFMHGIVVSPCCQG